MFAAAPAPIIAARPPHPVTAQSAQKTAQPQAPETARASAGETAAANLRTETPQAVKAAEQAAIAARLRDQERAETTDRTPPWKDEPTGPPPAFRESPLERQARVALEPPQVPEAPAPKTEAQANPAEDREAAPEAEAQDIDPPPTRTERAEASFAETRTLSEPKERATVNVAR